MYTRVYVEITNICNMHCSFCHGHSRMPRQMTEAEYAHVLEQLAGKTQYIYHHLMGEPLVHPLLPRFLQMASQAGFRPMLTTNGTLLDRYGDSLLIPGLHKINISLHSFEGAQQEAPVASSTSRRMYAGSSLSRRGVTLECTSGAGSAMVGAGISGAMPPDIISGFFFS